MLHGCVDIVNILFNGEISKKIMEAQMDISMT